MVAITAGLAQLTTGSPDTAHLDVTVPKLSGVAIEGEKVFAENCVVCHGENAAGSDLGPPLIHKIYEPNAAIPANWKDWGKFNSGAKDLIHKSSGVVGCFSGSFNSTG